MDTGDDIFLLRIINNEKNKISFVNDGRITYIIVETQISGKKTEILKPIVRTVRKVMDGANT